MEIWFCVSVYFSDNAPFDGWNFMRTCKIPDIFRQFSVIFVLLMYERPLVVTISLLKWCFCQAIIKLCFIIFVVWNIGDGKQFVGSDIGFSLDNCPCLWNYNHSSLFLVLISAFCWKKLLLCWSCNDNLIL